MITTSTFSPEAYRWVKSIEKQIVLIDGVALARFMVDHEVGVQEVRVLPLPRRRRLLRSHGVVGDPGNPVAALSVHARQPDGMAVDT